MLMRSMVIYSMSKPRNVDVSHVDVCGADVFNVDGVDADVFDTDIQKMQLLASIHLHIWVSTKLSQLGQEFPPELTILSEDPYLARTLHLIESRLAVLAPDRYSCVITRSTRPDFRHFTLKKKKGESNRERQGYIMKDIDDQPEPTGPSTFGELCVSPISSCRPSLEEQRKWKRHSTRNTASLPARYVFHPSE